MSDPFAGHWEAAEQIADLARKADDGTLAVSSSGPEAYAVLVATTPERVAMLNVIHNGWYPDGD